MIGRIFKLVPYLFLFFINQVNNFIFPTGKNAEISMGLAIFTCLVYFLADQLKNNFNAIIAKGWILFFVMGLMNINSVTRRTGVWNLKIEDATFFYFYCIGAFIAGLLIFERLVKVKPPENGFEDDFSNVAQSPYSYFMYLFPILLVITIYMAIGFLPLLSGLDFTDDMYGYNYGPLYGFKFVCVYSFLIALLGTLFYKSGPKVMNIIYLILLIFIISVDGKRFVLLICIIAAIPVYQWTNKAKNKKLSNGPIVLSFVVVGIVYILVSILRTGSDISHSITHIAENLPFGVEYKDYVHSFNTYEPGKIHGYNFELSAFGALANSSFLSILGFDKDQLVKFGSAYVWSNLYDSNFGIRTGIISELYFAYSYFVVPLMVVIAYFTNLVSQRLSNPKSVFNLLQNATLFALIFFLINGQATVFFGCLPVMMYVYFIFKLLTRKKNKKAEEGAPAGYPGMPPVQLIQ